MTQHSNKGLGTSIVPFSRDEFITPFDALFDNVIQQAFPAFSQEVGIEFFEKNSYPKVDVIDYDDKITIEAEIPGLTQEEVGVDLEQDVLTISGVKQSHETDTSARYLRKELKRSSFKRSFKLGENIDSKKIKAEFKDGILEVCIPKKKPESPKKVKIL
jgi:HSP20 family protein